MYTADEQGIALVQGGYFKRPQCVCVQVYFQPGPEWLALVLCEHGSELYSVLLPALLECCLPLCAHSQCLNRQRVILTCC